MKQLGRLLSVMTWLLIVGGIIIISGGLLGRPLLMAAVPTTSMVPKLVPGDLIVVLPTWTVAHPGIGEIVVYKTPQDRNWIVHRIVGGNATDGFILKGDANPISDPHPVFLRDMAGVVPQVGSAVLHLPRLGALHADSGPFSSPIVAGAALVVGVFLLVMDMQPIRMPRLQRRRRRQLKSESILSIYMGLVGTAFITTLIPAWTLSSNQPISYQIIASRPANVKPFGQYLAYEGHQEEVTIDNPSPVPLLVTFHTDDPYLTYQPWYKIVPPHQHRTFAARINNPNLGVHEGTLRMGVFVPLLPPPLLAGLASQSIALAAVMVSLIPGGAVFLLALTDARARSALARIRTQIMLRFTHS